MKKLLGMIGSLGIIASTGTMNVVSCDKAPSIHNSDEPDFDFDPKNITGDPSEFNFYNRIYDMGELSIKQFAKKDDDTTIGENINAAIKGGLYQIIENHSLDFINDHPIDTNPDHSGVQAFDYYNIGLISVTSQDHYKVSELNKVKFYYISTKDFKPYSIIFNFSIKLNNI